MSQCYAEKSKQTYLSEISRPLDTEGRASTKKITLIVEREGFILQRLSDLRNLGISRVEPESTASNDQFSTSSEGTQETGHLSVDRDIVRQYSISAVMRELIVLTNRALTPFIPHDQPSQISKWETE